jgi:glycosyltransferase involved in cell wall biosynthesis
LIIAILGRRDFPTDAVEDYCRLLGEALTERGAEFKLVRLPWDRTGWIRTLRDLWSQTAEWSDGWALVQYTALMWSRRGFPLRLLLVLMLLRFRGQRVSVVFHDVEPYAGKRLVDKVRRACQRLVMRCAHQISTISVITVPADQVSWFATKSTKVRFIPVGSNVPPPASSRPSVGASNGQKTVAAFSFSSASQQQVRDFAVAIKWAATEVPKLRLSLLGRTMDGAEAVIRDVLDGTAVEISTLGLLPAQEVSRNLAAADVVLFTRGQINTNRGSTIAAIACGVPVVAYGRPEPGSPLAEAGILFVPYGDRRALSKALVKVLSDRQLWCDLHRRNISAHQRYFSWVSIAEAYGNLLQNAHFPSVPN